MSSPEDAKARLIAAVHASPSPVRAVVARTDRARAACAVAFVVVLFTGMGGVHAGARSAGFIALSGLAWGTIALVTTLLAVPRGRSMLGASVPWLLAATLAVVPLLAASWLCLPAPSSLQAAHGVRSDAVCFALTVALALAPLFHFMRARSGTDPLHPALTGAALGAAAGAWGACLIDLHCWRVDLAHVLAGHVAPVLVLTVVGAVWGHRALGLGDDATG
jgi:hypothetical protein